MAQGYYTIEQWTRGKKGSPGAWVEILHLPFGRSLTEAETAVKNLGAPRLYRVVQMQWVVKTYQQKRRRRLNTAVLVRTPKS
jgi:hypothetical protein